MIDNNVWSKADGGEGERIFLASSEEAISRWPPTIVSVVWSLLLSDFFFLPFLVIQNFNSSFKLEYLLKGWAIFVFI